MDRTASASEGARGTGRQRPSLLALLALGAGVAATVATSPPASEATTSVEVVLDEAEPAVRLRWESTAPAGTELDRADLRWEATSESGVAPRLSVTDTNTALDREPPVPGLHDADGVRFAESTFDGVSGLGRAAELEIAVANITETGPVTLAVTGGVAVEGDDDPAASLIATNRSAPSGALAIPPYRRSVHAGPEYSAYDVWATAPAGAASPGVSLSASVADADLGVVVDGEQVELVDGLVPWPDDCGDRCSLELTVAVPVATPVVVDTGDADGTVTAVGRLPVASEPRWLRLDPGPLLAEERVEELEVELAEVGDPFDGYVVVEARLAEPLPEGRCSTTVAFTVGEETTVVDEFVGNSGGGRRSATFAPGRATAVDIVLGRAEPAAVCDLPADTEVTVEVGVITYGLDDPAPAELARR